MIWFFSHPDVTGVHAIPITPGGKVVLVKLTYDDGWRLPGGGQRADEAADAAVLRELREEIGLLSHGELLKVARFEQHRHHRNDRSTLFLLRDVIYRPAWSLEIASIGEFDMGDLPADAAPITRRLIAKASTLML